MSQVVSQCRKVDYASSTNKKKKKKKEKKKKNEQEKEFHDFNSTQIEVNIKTRLIDYSFYSRVSFIY